MDKKQFFESFISLLPDNSGHRLESFGRIQEVFASIKAGLTDKNLQNRFEQVEKEILFYVWALDRVCTGCTDVGKDGQSASGPLIVISILWEIIFVNKAYCKLSGLLPSEIQGYQQDGTLYSKIYSWTDLEEANKAVSRLQAGKGYKHLELLMKNSGRKISWNSYGWVGESLEIRSGREVNDENDQKREQERFFRGSLMNTSRLIESLYQVCIHGMISQENELKLMWIQEFLSMLDFLWNHSEFFMEIIDMPTTKSGKIRGCYNTVYAQFFKCSYNEQKKFKDTLLTVHKMTILQFLEARKIHDGVSVGEFAFHKNNKCPVADVSWQYSAYPHEVLPWYGKIFSIGALVRKIHRRNIFFRILLSIFKKRTPST